ncbi:PXA domain-containing protein [Phyllosticta citriasiana]|uniref:PXA domain-containing protein n=1 Tax=Phyllosticta citriasiana TaxID=595635 RepID=UPI0030FDA73C
MDSSSQDSTSSNHPDYGQQPAPAAKDAPSPDSPRLPPGPLVDIQSLTDHALRFLSTASNETLGACLVGLGGVTYLVLGRVGLVLMGVVGGIVLHAQWENNIQELFGDETARAGEEKRRKETSLDVLKRVLDLQAQKQSESARRDDDLDVQLFSGKQLDYSTFQPETAEALDELTDAVIRDYVKWWYTPIVPIEMAFPNACRQTLTAFVLSVSNHLSRKRPADFFLEYLTNSSAIIIVFLNELSDAIAASPTTAAPEAIQTYLKLKPDSKLAHVLDRKHQANKLEAVAEDILQNYLEPKTYNCRPARIFLREILAKVILEMTVINCSKPEWINGWIVYLLEEGEPELMKEIDAGVEGSAGKRLEDVKDQGEAAEEEMNGQSPDRSRSHRRNVSKAQEAMDEAMKEAKRLTQLIIEEDERKARGSDEPEKDAGSQGRDNSRQSNDDTSDGTTQGAATPSSSQSDRDNNEERDPSLRDSVMTSRAINNDTTKPDTANAQPSANPSRPASQDSKNQPFTSFDQVIGNPNLPTALGGTPQNVGKPPPLTLCNAKVAMFDDSVPGDKSSIRSKPTGDYFIQIEPASAQYPGWMISRKYTDFETLHEVLRRIAVVAGVGFNEAHSSLPAWKGHTKPSLRGELERYLNDALCWQPLADSEGIKRFFEKDTGFQAAAGKGFGWPSSAFENVGKGMFDTLTKAPNQVAGGGKALFGGVTGVLGGLGPKKRTTSSTTLNKSDETAQSAAARHKRAESTVSELPNPSHMRSESMISVNQAGRKSTESVRSPLGRRSQDSVRNTLVVDQQPAPIQQMERRPSWNPDENEQKTRPGSSSRSSTYGKSSREHSRAPSRAPSGRDSIDISPLMGGDQILNLPPLPSDISDDYGSPSHPSSPEARRSNTWHQRDDSRRLSRASTVATSLTSDLQSPPKMAPRSNTSKMTPKKGEDPKQKTPLNEGETQMAVELFFAIINELYTLSSAWQIRKTLLNAAKTFLLRPGNPQLESIRVLLQDTVLEANSCDSGIASHIKKLRANTLPTEEELKAWPPEMSEEEKEKLRLKARKLLIERGMPQALTSVMGQAATGEALGKVFDCLQVSEVARGFMFGLLLQGVRAVAA